MKANSLIDLTPSPDTEQSAVFRSHPILSSTPEQMEEPARTTNGTPALVQVPLGKQGDGSVDGDSLSETHPMIVKEGPWLSHIPAGRHREPHLVNFKEYHLMSTEPPPKKCSARMCMTGSCVTLALVAAGIIVALVSVE